MNQPIARLAVSGIPYAADKLYSYLIPSQLADSVRPGMRVSIPFGRGNRRTEGFVLERLEGDAAKLKPIQSVMDSEPLMDGEEMRLVKWMKARYFCTYYDAIKTILPAGVWFRYREKYRANDDLDWKSLQLEETEHSLLRAVVSLGEAERAQLEAVFGKDVDGPLQSLEKQGLIHKVRSAKQKVSDKSVRMVSLAVSAEDAMALAEKKRKSAPVRAAAIELLCAEGRISSTELCYYTGATTTTLKKLEADGIVTFSEEEVLRVSRYEPIEQAEPIVLNEEQEAAYHGLAALMSSGEAAGALLHGVTASGKTLVYIRLIQELLRRGRNALVLVPEIALTPQMMAKFTAYFGDEVAMLHSALRLTERYDQWKRIRRGEVRVVLGTRSAVFAPLTNLGLVIMDEEQEATYRSENPPRYQAGDIAQFRCAQSGALLLFGSATPSVETAYYARHGRYQVFSLHNRYNQKSLPKVLIADMRQELRRGNDGALSALLRHELEENLSRGEQSILFLNRRGNARMLICGECGHVPECPRCSAPLTYHSANHRLMCHYCGFSQAVYETCPECGSRMKRLGFGTQKVEEELAAIFPGTRVLRMDTDTVSAAHSHEKLLSEFEKENIPILLGTQMVAKGLDFENVTLVGVLAADLSLYVNNYHAPERTFNLLAQVIGRAGRGSRQGRAVIQTFTPENDVICAAAAQDYEAFYQSEIRMRKLRRYPPFADLFTFTVTGADEAQVIRAAAALRDGLREAVKQQGLCELEPEVLGPAGAPVVKVNNRYRYRVYLVGKNCSALRRLVAEFLHAFYRHRENRGLDVFADCNALQ